MWLAFYFLLFGSSDSAAGYEENMFDATSCNGKVMILGYAYETLLNVNLNTCAQRCSRDYHCKSFDFNFQSCILNNDKDPGDCSKMKTTDVPSLHYEKHTNVKQCQNGGVLNLILNVCSCLVGYAGELCQRLIKDICPKLTGSWHDYSLYIRRKNKIYLNRKYYACPCFRLYRRLPNWCTKRCTVFRPLAAPTSFQAFCRNGETVIMSRSDSSVSYFRGWFGYKVFFGIPSGDYWIGLDNLHYLTMDGESTLKLLWRLHNGTAYTQFYNTFTVDDELSFYMMTFTSSYGGSSNVMGDSFSSSNGTMFSTYDKDNDNNLDHCANVMGGAGWWYGINCNETCLTCALHQPVDQLRVYYDEIVWQANMMSLVPKIIKMSLTR